MQFDNSYVRLPPRFYSEERAEVVPKPQLLAWNASLAEQLGLQDLSDDPQLVAQVFGGNQLLPGMQPIALAYAGHQFGNFVPQLGDGRALLLGELVDTDSQRQDVQLKGSGMTPYSRRGDGKSSLGPVLREYLVSEAMHRLGVPTTRALAAVSSGERVVREAMVPGGVMTRVARSHLRVGTFEYFAARRDTEALQILVDYAIERLYPQVTSDDIPSRALALFDEVVAAQARLIAHWMSLGFIHGVMNTDNCAISGQTLDYGPCAFMDEFERAKVFSSIDRHGRYAYQQQPSIGLWNLTRLAECLLLLGGEQSGYEKSLMRFEGQFRQHYRGLMRRKLGLQTEQEGDAELIETLLGYLEQYALDYTLSFRQLAERVSAQDNSAFGPFEEKWRQRLQAENADLDEVAVRMNAANPLVIPRNHQIERVIAAAFKGDFGLFERMQQALAEPYVSQPGLEEFSEAPEVQERVTQTFCGT